MRQTKESLAPIMLESRSIEDRGYETPCWIWTKTCFTKTGYGSKCVSFVGEKMKVTYSVHRLAAFLWLDFDLHSHLWVLHRCDIKACFNPDHLFVGTAADNTRDMMMKGRDRHRKGSTVGTAKLTEDQVVEIRHLRETTDLSYTALGGIYGVSRSAVALIIHRVNWAHL